MANRVTAAARKQQENSKKSICLTPTEGRCWIWVEWGPVQELWPIVKIGGPPVYALEDRNRTPRVRLGAREGRSSCFARWKVWRIKKEERRAALDVQGESTASQKACKSNILINGGVIVNSAYYTFSPLHKTYHIYITIGGVLSLRFRLTIFNAGCNCGGEKNATV